jgi:cytidylate kinase
MIDPSNLPGIRNITVSGRIASGATTLAHRLADTLGWQIFDGGSLFRDFMSQAHIPVSDTAARKDAFDLMYEERISKILRTKTHYILESHLAGYDAVGIPGIFKVLLICEDPAGADKTDIRIDRLSNRDKISIQKAKKEVGQREDANLEKWRRLYADNDSSWVYWNKKYYDLVINTYSHNAAETAQIVLKAVGFSEKG